MIQTISRLALTPGEPAGVGPELALAMAQWDWPGEIVLLGDTDLLLERSRVLETPVEIQHWDRRAPAQANRIGQVKVAPIPVAAPVEPGRPSPANAGYVMETLQRAVGGCVEGLFHAMVTGPVHKSVISESGVAFTGHTEFLAEQTGWGTPVMMLVADSLRVALLTTHLPLREVADQVTPQRLESACRVLHRDLQHRFGLESPRICVLGLNPHAGESGHLGSEERTIMEPAIQRLREEGMRVSGPMPADTAFLPRVRDQVDVFLAMYHDQGLPVLKAAGFGRAVNVTLGLPIVRTSVDHGTALDLAATGKADPGSLREAVHLAFAMADQAT